MAGIITRAVEQGQSIYLTEEAHGHGLEVVAVCRTEESYDRTIAQFGRSGSVPGLVLSGQVEGARKARKGSILGYNGTTRNYFVR